MYFILVEDEQADQDVRLLKLLMELSKIQKIFWLYTTLLVSMFSVSSHVGLFGNETDDGMVKATIHINDEVDVHHSIGEKFSIMGISITATFGVFDLQLG